MGRRRFDHLHVELSVALGQRLPRYGLWLAVREGGWDPEGWSRPETLAFFDGALDDFLHTRGLALPPRRWRRVRRAVERFDPALPTPEERLAALAAR